MLSSEEMLNVICGFSHLSGDKVSRINLIYSIYSFSPKMLEAEKCVADIDVDKDGKVSYPEFLLVWKYRL